MAKDYMVRARVTKDQMDRLEELASELSVSPATVVRELLAKATVTVKPVLIIQGKD